MNGFKRARQSVARREECLKEGILQREQESAGGVDIWKPGQGKQEVLWRKVWKTRLSHGMRQWERRGGNEAGLGGVDQDGAGRWIINKVGHQHPSPLKACSWL
ncbi:hypothetical protein E2C01_089881 [Portunus trituberculatus]|uniref:Uncharacterized protein n=1 Tax=Portunus trituberculatus TaxID=210409 RepID=A0A5B7JA06_PORTR|nr:hypothetical protein [Portunus trituberculatus]